MGMLTKYMRMYAEKRLCQNGKKKDRLCTVLRGLRYSLNVIEDCKYLLQTKQNQALSEGLSKQRGFLTLTKQQQLFEARGVLFRQLLTDFLPIKSEFLSFFWLLRRHLLHSLC